MFLDVIDEPESCMDRFVQLMNMLPKNLDIFRLSTDELFKKWEKQVPAGIDEAVDEKEEEEDRAGLIEIKPKEKYKQLKTAFRLLTDILEGGGSSYGGSRKSGESDSDDVDDIHDLTA